MLSLRNIGWNVPLNYKFDLNCRQVLDGGWSPSCWPGQKGGVHNTCRWRYYALRQGKARWVVLGQCRGERSHAASVLNLFWRPRPVIVLERGRAVSSAEKRCQSLNRMEGSWCGDAYCGLKQSVTQNKIYINT